MVWLNGDDAAFVTLWGGPTWIEADNTHPDDEGELQEWGVQLQMLWERAGDDGPCWRRRYLLCGVEVQRVVMANGQAHAQLPFGTWIALDGDGTDLAEQAIVLSIYDNREPELEVRHTWGSLGARAVSIVRED